MNPNSQEENYILYVWCHFAHLNKWNMSNDAIIYGLKDNFELFFSKGNSFVLCFFKIFSWTEKISPQILYLNRCATFILFIQHNNVTLQVTASSEHKQNDSVRRWTACSLSLWLKRGLIRLIIRIRTFSRVLLSTLTFWYLCWGAFYEPRARNVLIRLCLLKVLLLWEDQNFLASASGGTMSPRQPDRFNRISFADETFYCDTN